MTEDQIDKKKKPCTYRSYKYLCMYTQNRRTKISQEEMKKGIGKDNKLKKADGCSGVGTRRYIMSSGLKRCVCKIIMIKFTDFFWKLHLIYLVLSYPFLK